MSGAFDHDPDQHCARVAEQNLALKDRLVPTDRGTARPGTINRDRVPSWPQYASDEGLVLHGRDKWRTMLCDFHDDHKPSLRVNVESGGWRCMSCGAKGGDTLSHYMQRTGLSFVAAARMLGAIDDKGQPLRPQRRFSASDALGCIERELYVCSVVIGDARKGRLPSDADWQRFLAAAGTVIGIAGEARK